MIVDCPCGCVLGWLLADRPDHGYLLLLLSEATRHRRLYYVFLTLFAADEQLSKKCSRDNGRASDD